MGRGEKMDSPAVYTQAVGGGGVNVFLVKGVGGSTHFKEITREKITSVFVPCSCFRLKVKVKVIEYQGILLVRDMKSEAGMKVEVQILEFANP